MNSGTLSSLLEDINSRNEAITSVLVIRNGYIVLEANKGDIDRPRPLHSSTKSISSALVGIAVTKGIIDGPDQPITDFFRFPEAVSQRRGERDITLKHLLTMSSGVDWPEVGISYMHTNNALYQMHMCDNWVEYILKRPPALEPGVQFSYNSGSSHLLLAAIARSGIDVGTFAHENLFRPLGISKEQYVWSKDPQNIPNGSNGLVLKPRDMAKLGYLYLKGGVWEGKQIISRQWIAESTRKHIEVNWCGHISKFYGYQWYVQPYGFHSMGSKGQFIFVLPNRNLVAVFTSELSTHELEIPIKYVEHHILTAIESERSLPGNPERINQLTQQVDLFNGP